MFQEILETIIEIEWESIDEAKGDLRLDIDQPFVSNSNLDVRNKQWVDPDNFLFLF